MMVKSIIKESLSLDFGLCDDDEITIDRMIVQANNDRALRIGRDLIKRHVQRDKEQDYKSFADFEDSLYFEFCFIKRK